MNEEKLYFVYILTNPRKSVLYIGVTGNLASRITQHREQLIDGFAKKYNCKHLVYAEPYEYVHDALEREKQLKKWNRKKKEWLIEQENPEWDDLGNFL